MKTANSRSDAGGLPRTLGAADLALIGIGATIGTGIFLLTGRVAATDAGPGIVLSYGVAGLACVFAALCYAELAAMIPASGSAYSYSCVALGDAAGWVIGWDLILEYAVGAMTVAVVWSAYFQRILAGAGITLPAWMSSSPGPPGAVLNLPAILIVAAITVPLVVGIRQSVRMNAIIVAVKVAVVLLFIAAGAGSVDSANWSPFLPFGFGGVVQGAALVFFAYIGFDAASTAAEETRNPGRDLPLGMLSALAICTVLYLLVAVVFAGIVPVVQLRSNSQFLDAPIGFALQTALGEWGPRIITVGAFAGVTNLMLVMLMAQSRILMAMSRDGFMPRVLATIHPRYGTPYVSTIVIGLIVAIVAGFVPVTLVGELTSIGTLFAFVVVAVAVVVLRHTRSETHRPFKVPFGPTVPVLAILFCGYLMLNLSVMTWAGFLLWLNAGVVVYLLCVRRRRTGASRGHRIGALRVGGGALLFNGVSLLLLWRVTSGGSSGRPLNEWSELEATLFRFHIGFDPAVVPVAGAALLISGMLGVFFQRIMGRSGSAR
jgi:basic amino acid/polyamine antiporter, APA family